MWVSSMSSSVSAVSSPKEARRVWCGWGSRTITSLVVRLWRGEAIRAYYIVTDNVIFVHSCTFACTNAVLSVDKRTASKQHVPEGEGGNKDTLHSDRLAGEEDMISNVCMSTCSTYMYMCACMCAHIPHRAPRPLTWHGPCSRFSVDVLKQLEETPYTIVYRYMHLR